MTRTEIYLLAVAIAPVHLLQRLDVMALHYRERRRRRCHQATADRVSRGA